MAEIAQHHLTPEAKTSVQDLLDLDNYVDYMLLNFYAGNDWDWNHFQNWMGASERGGGEGYKFFAWDSDMMLRTRLNANVINRGDFIMWRDIDMPRRGLGSALADRISNEERAVSIAVDHISSVSTLVRPE